jgi:hypothetical protein
MVWRVLLPPFLRCNQSKNWSGPEDVDSRTLRNVSNYASRCGVVFQRLFPFKLGRPVTHKFVLRRLCFEKSASYLEEKSSNMRDHYEFSDGKPQTNKDKEWSVVSKSPSKVRPARPRPRAQHDCHHDRKIKPEAATAVIELLTMGGKTPETCWAVNKRQDINWKIVASGWWFIWIVGWCKDLQTLNFTFKF